MQKQRFYKKLEELPQDYHIDLHNWIKKNAEEYFNNKDYHACDERDFEDFPTKQTDREHLVRYGELMLVDLETSQCDHAYCIVQISRRKHKLSSGRLVHCKIIYSVIPVKDIASSVWKNGYFLLPIIPTKESED